MKSKACILNYQRQEGHHISYELIIQANTIITLYGFNEAAPVAASPVAQQVNFEDIGEADGLI